MAGLVIFILFIAAIVLSVWRGRDSRVLDDERGWWPGSRRDDR